LALRDAMIQTLILKVVMLSKSKCDKYKKILFFLVSSWYLTNFKAILLSEVINPSLLLLFKVLKTPTLKYPHVAEIVQLI
jgi:hypothetical protein